MRLRVGATGLDVSFARPPAARVLELGYEFLVGYISLPPASPAKNLSKLDRDGYVAAGLEVPLVWEMTAARANLGAAYGTFDGAAAKTLAGQRAYPVWMPILVADDTNTTGGILGALAAIGRAIKGVFSGGNIDAQEAYMRAFAAACAPYPIGIYGDIDILTRCLGLWVLGWLPNAWAWSGTSRANAEARARALGVHVLQRKGFYIDNTWAVDPNEVIKAVEFGPTSTGSTDPPSGEDDMDIVRNAEPRTYADAGPYPADVLKFAVMLDGTLRHLTEVELTARGIVNSPTLGTPLTNAQLDEFDIFMPAVFGTPVIDYAALAAALAAEIPTKFDGTIQITAAG